LAEGYGPHENSEVVMRTPSSQRSTGRRNYLLAILEGLLNKMGMNLTNPGLVLPVFIRALGGSNTLVGMLSTLRFSGWYLPQFLVTAWMQPQPHKVPITVAMGISRAVIYGTLTVLTCTLSLSHPTLLLSLFFLLFVGSRLAAGTGGLARLDTFGKIIAPPQRASFFATRNFWGGIVVFGVGLLVRYLLDPTNGPPFPFDFTLLFALSTCSFLAAVLSFARIQEPLDPIQQAHRSLKDQLKRAPRLLKKDQGLRRYLLSRVLFNMTRLAGPFYPIFALDILGAPASMVGFYLSAMTLASVLSNLLWQKVGETRGTYFLLKASSLLTVLPPLLAATLLWLMRSLGFTVERYGLLPAYLFTGVFLLAGSSNSGRGAGLPALLLDISPDEERTTYIGLVNTVLGIVNFLPILAGAVIDRLGFAPVFAAATALLLLGYLTILKWNWKSMDNAHP